MVSSQSCQFTSKAWHETKVSCTKQRCQGASAQAGENIEQSLLDRTQSRNSDGQPFVPRSRGLLGVREAAQKDKNLKFTSLLHHITPELLRASFFDLKKQAAPGIDGETWQDYATDFEHRIDDLHGRIHRGAYRAKPSKRTYIPKPDGRKFRTGACLARSV